MKGVLNLVAAAALSLALGGTALAQVAPPHLPPPPIDPVPKALADAYAAIVRANAAPSASTNAAATQANFLYAQALARYRAGDRTSAAYDAALAAGMANAAYSHTTVPLLHVQQTPALFAPSGIALPVVLPNELLRARNEIERVEQLTGNPLTDASARYRAALDRFFSGDIAGARAGADAAYRAAHAAAPPGR